MIGQSLLQFRSYYVISLCRTADLYLSLRLAQLLRGNRAVSSSSSTPPDVVEYYPLSIIYTNLDRDGVSTYCLKAAFRAIPPQMLSSRAWDTKTMITRATAWEGPSDLGEKPTLYQDVKYPTRYSACYRILSRPADAKNTFKHRNKTPVLVPGYFSDSALEESAGNPHLGDMHDSPVLSTPNYRAALLEDRSWITAKQQE